MDDCGLFNYIQFDYWCIEYKSSLEIKFILYFDVGISYYKYVSLFIGNYLINVFVIMLIYIEFISF